VDRKERYGGVFKKINEGIAVYKAFNSENDSNCY